MQTVWSNLKLSCALAVCLAATLAAAQDEDPADFLPGLRAEFRGRDGAKFARIDPAVSFAWGHARPDERLAPGGFSARWTGRLLCLQPSEHRLHVFAAGTFRLELHGKELLHGASVEPKWFESAPVTLDFGLRRLEIEYSSERPPARLALFWSGPGFALEPVSERHLFHPPAEDESSLAAFERGRLLARALRCAACHVLPVAETAPLAGPSLKHLRGNVDPQWLAEWIQHAGHAAVAQEADPNAGGVQWRMPGFDLTRDEAAGIAAYLLADSQPPPAATTRPPSPPHDETDNKSEQKNKRREPSAAAGEALFHVLGCLACHRVGGLGESNLFGGGDLARVAEKRPLEFFERWLRNPETINPRHRMPVFPLHELERRDLAAYLAEQGKPQGAAAREEIDARLTDRVAERGRRLAVEHRCGACHDLPGEPGKSERAALADKPRVLSADSDWESSCGAAADISRRRPGYQLSGADQVALREYLSLARRQEGEFPAVDGQFVLAERNCLACHARGLGEGIEPLLTPVTDRFPQLRAVQAAMEPPALHGVGDKLHEQALGDAIALKHAPLRPWLKVRMPRFDLAVEESAALIEHLIEHDRIPQGGTGGLRATGGLPASAPRADKQPVPPNDPRADKQPVPPEVSLAGSRLVTADGFGCTSCHGIGDVASAKAELKSRGPNLSLLGRRVRREWYDRFLPSPARIVPRMEMPSIVAPVRGVLDDDLPAQLDAVWRVLNTPGFTPPPADPERIVRLRNVGDAKERAAVLTDVIEVGDGQAKRTYVKPLVIGLPNRHNILFDLETNQVAAWWIGDVARQRTRGKSWYWEPAGTQLLPPLDAASELTLADDKGNQHSPRADGQFATEFNSVEHLADGVRFRHRLAFAPREGEEQPATFTVTQTFTAIRAGESKEVPSSGFRRVLEVSPASPDLHFRALPPDYKGPHGIVAASPRREKDRLVYEIEYRTELPIDSFPLDLLVSVLPPARILNVVPGYEATELSLPAEIMPTALAWRKDGTLVIASLNGQVWLAKDTNADGMEDFVSPFSDDLAAPYGLGINDDSIDVLNKYALLRLYDLDDDGRADRTETIASGWGHTADYHDWAVGLPRDEQGNYYLALPCEQDGRSAAAAHLRGTALKLIPPKRDERATGSMPASAPQADKQPVPPDAKGGTGGLPASDPGASDPRADKRSMPHNRYTIEVLCGGLRFPMGLALSKNGELFASDNQGNYNPFNELNHLQPGKRYGFINSHERKQKNFNPSFEPPAIDIPHPWTRSVNGICFLNSPEGATGGLGGTGGSPASVPRADKQPVPRSFFGPFEGHLLGCEYDTRRLVRMSLEKVGGTYQGAVYPFTLDPQGGTGSLPANDKGGTGSLPASAPRADNQPVPPENTRADEQPVAHLQGPVVCAVSPDGDLYVGNMRDSGWGGGSNVGSLVRLRPSGELPCGIAEVRVAKDGFVIRFTRPVDEKLGRDPAGYAVSSYRRISTPEYGGPDVDRAIEKIASLTLSPDRMQATLQLDRLREGFVYEFRLKNLVGGDAVFHPAEAHYTLRKKR